MTDLAHDRLVQLCEDLKLPGVADSYAALAATASEQGQSFTDYLEGVLLAERDFRRSRSAATMVRMAGFPAVKTLESYEGTSKNCHDQAVGVGSRGYSAAGA